MFTLALIMGAFLGELKIEEAALVAQDALVSIPEEYAFRIPTLNRYGYMFTRFDPVTEHFFKAIEDQPAQTVFEVGGAYGNVAEAAWRLGIDHYYLNDAEPFHLQLFAKKLCNQEAGEDFSSLHLIPGRCPEDVEIPEDAFDAILVNKVLHFFTPDTIDSFVSWVHRGLKPDGHVYLLPGT